MAYICQYLSKTEDRYLEAMKQTAKEAFENNIHHHDTMKTTAEAYFNNQECSVQDAVYYILPEFKLRRVFQPVYFVNTNPPEERVQVLLSDKEFSELPDDSPNIFQKSNIDRYGKIKCNILQWKNSILDDFCQAELLGYHALEKKSSKTCEYGPGELD